MIPLPCTDYQTTIDHDQLLPILKKLFDKTKSYNLLKLDYQTNKIKIKSDLPHLTTLYLESPFILLHAFDLLKLISLGKCCSYCGEVLKVYDNGRLRDDGANGEKSKRTKGTTDAKHDRFISGLDCNDCSLCWCSKECKNLDFKHCILYHSATNKSMSHLFLDVNGVKKDVFHYPSWITLKNYLLDNKLDLCYYGIMVVLQLYYDVELIETYKSLKCLDSEDLKIYEEFLLSEQLKSPDTDSRRIDFNHCYGLLIKCFKQLETNLNYLDFLKYLTIFRLNNYNNSIYLIASLLDRSDEALNINSKVEYYDFTVNSDYDEFQIKNVNSNHVQIVKQHITDDSIRKPIYTNRTSGVIDKKIIKISNTCKVKSGSKLVIRDQDYSNPIDIDDDEICLVSDDEIDDDIPRIILPSSPLNFSSNSSKLLSKPKKKAASFTSSGNSFGEGIIKYNRDQIRDMLQQLSLPSYIEEKTDDESDIANSNAIDDDESSNATGEDVVKLIRHIRSATGDTKERDQFQLPFEVNSNSRRKSVRFDDEITTF